MPKDRALNYAATNAFQVSHVFAKALADKMALDTIPMKKARSAAPRPILGCRPHFLQAGG